ncbi:hypothetical protein TWF730_009760 [Orbilia blumenaviensis]|uniref:Uncharacterized protein n=1 Tax=Orbilia blumenaviensis TaxID=1796055 RepID=A0AAV9UZB4_9PEZI
MAPGEKEHPERGRGPKATPGVRKEKRTQSVDSGAKAKDKRGGEQVKAGSRGRQEGEQAKAGSRGREGEQAKAGSRGRGGEQAKAGSRGRGGEQAKAGSRERGGERARAGSRVRRGGERARADSRGRGGEQAKAGSRERGGERARAGSRVRRGGERARADSRVRRGGERARAGSRERGERSESATKVESRKRPRNWEPGDSHFDDSIISGCTIAHNNNIDRGWKVKILILYFKHNDLELEEELRKVEDGFKVMDKSGSKNFHIETYPIPVGNSLRHLQHKLDAFTVSQTDYGKISYIIYYSGHGGWSLESSPEYVLSREVPSLDNSVPPWY